jgi:hypothetical protein
MAASGASSVLLQGGYKGTAERADGRGAYIGTIRTLPEIN